ncbi:MAG: ATP-binding protein [Nocardioidaceae bacterium]
MDTAYQRLREHLAYLGLTTAAEELAPALDRATKQKLSAVEVLEDLLGREAEATRARRLHGRLRFAHYPLRKTLAEFEFDYQPSVDGKVFGELSTLAFVEERRNVLLLGPPGVGKTHCETASTVRTKSRGRIGPAAVGTTPKTHWPASSGAFALDLSAPPLSAPARVRRDVGLIRSLSALRA